jgi:hypothetical protein
MKIEQIEKEANRIADAIVELVERVNGPVTLALIHHTIAGFAEEGSDWGYVVEDLEGKETLIWKGMTEPGSQALVKVLRDRRVAIQRLRNMLLYLFSGLYPDDANWWPVVLVPARAANLHGPRWLHRASQTYLRHCMRRAKAEGLAGFWLLKPAALDHTVDHFAV